MDPLAAAPARRVPTRVALLAAKTLTWAGLLGVVVAAGPPAGAPDRADAEARPGVTQPADRPECAAALIRTTRGTLRRVSFAVGWDVYTGRRPGTLVAACLDADHP